VVVDYAHTPDALEQALRALREVCKGQLWCVFGCGGERDPGKRPLMGKLAEALADHVVLTNDNPRGEEPFSIIQDILSGIREKARVYVEPERTRAIERAVLQAGEEDVVLLAGKGHETYQEIRGQRLPLSDRDAVRRILGGDTL
jgi:UDP-N-acetylmuramoyl-L-alanyl-D-glutamate--2,6-diaminopimelate ligase